MIRNQENLDFSVTTTSSSCVYGASSGAACLLRGKISRLGWSTLSPPPDALPGRSRRATPAFPCCKPFSSAQAVLAWHPSSSNDVKSYHSDTKAHQNGFYSGVNDKASCWVKGNQRFLCVCSGWRLRGRVQEYKFIHYLLYDSVCSQPPSVQRSLFLCRLSHNSPISKKTLRLQRRMRLQDY